MKLVLDEKLKHRIIGLAVIVSIVAIFAPAVMKKSSQRFENNINMNVRLPERPGEPRIVKADEEQVFQTVKVAHVDLEPGAADPGSLPQLAEAQPIKAIPKSEGIRQTTATQLASLDEVKPVVNPVAPAVSKATKQVKAATPAVKAKVVAKQPARAVVKPAAKKPVVAKPKPPVPVRQAVRGASYAVQLASFSSQANAQILVNKLQRKGYRGQITRVPGRNGTMYKVTVGGARQKADALRLRNQLASAVQINGFVVSGVS